MILQRKSTTSGANVKSAENSLTQTLPRFNAFQTLVIIKKMRSLITPENVKHVKSSFTLMNSVISASRTHALKVRYSKPQVNARLAPNTLVLMIHNELAYQMNVTKQHKSLASLENARHVLNSLSLIQIILNAFQTLVILLHSTLEQMESAFPVSLTLTQTKSHKLAKKIHVMMPHKY